MFVVFAGGDRFGAVHWGPDSSVEIDPNAPAVYTDRSEVVLNGRRYDQVAYTWYYPRDGADDEGGALNAQGVRITVDGFGQPCIWEVLADETGARIIYVSASLEQAAAEQFGPPLAGRRYSIERAVEDQPDVVVARVLDDGPVAMGPFVYLRAGTRSVGTLLCRCMPSQVEAFVETEYYDLLSIDHLTAIVVEGRELLSFLLPGPLNNHLRLPDDF